MRPQVIAHRRRQTDDQSTIEPPATARDDNEHTEPAAAESGSIVPVVAWRWNPTSMSWTRITRHRVVAALDFVADDETNDAQSSAHDVGGSEAGAIAPAPAWRWNATTRSWTRTARAGLPGSGPLDRSDVEDRNIGLGRSNSKGPDHPGRQSVTRNIAALLLAQIATWVASMGLSISQSRFLGPSGMGKLGLVWALWTVAGVLVTFGTATLITMESARNPRDGAAMAGTAVRYQAIPTGGALVVLQLYGWLSGYDRTTLLLLSIVGVTVYFQLCAGSIRAFSYGMERMGTTSMIDVVHRVVYVTLVFIVLAAGFGIIGSALMNLLVTTSNLFVMWRVLHTRMAIPIDGSFGDYRAILRRSRPYFVSEAIVVAYQQVDVIVVSILLTTTSLGYYSVSITLFGTLLFLPNIVATSTFPVLSRLHTEDPTKALAFLEKSLGTMMLVSGPVIAATPALGTQVIALLYGDEFAPAAPILRLMGVVLLFTVPSIILGRYALVIGRQHQWAVASAIAAVITIPLDIVLVERCDAWFGNGAIAGALTFIITEGLLTAFGVVFIAPHLINARFAIRLAKIALAMGVMYGVSWQLRHQFILLPPVAGGIAYAATALALKVLEPQELDAARKQLHRFVGGSR